MDEVDTPNVLAVGARLANLARAKAVRDVSAEQTSLAEVGTAREALSLLRVVPFDLVAVGDDMSDATVLQFARRLRQAKPWQKWLVVSDAAMESDEEVMLRTLGAIAILDGPDAWQEVVNVARRLRRARPETTVPGLALDGHLNSN